MAKTKKNAHGAHKTVTVSRGEVEIDEMLAPLIRLVWAAGIQTSQCCQEERPGEAYIEFPGTGEVEEFLDVAQKNYLVELERWDEGARGVHSYRVRLLVFFPVKDIPRLIKAFTEVIEYQLANA